MEISEKKDYLLAKRRVLVMFPFLLINFVISIVMIVFSAIPYHRISKINDDYVISYKVYDQYIKRDEILCGKIRDNMYKIDYNFNFSHIFGLYDDDDESIEKFEDYTAGNLAFSISSVAFLLLFIGISLCFCPSYACTSDEKLKEKKEHFPNKKHATTTCFFIFKIVTFSLIDIYLIAFYLLTISINSDFFEDVYYFHDYCLTNTDIMEKFRNDYSYCWDIDSPLDVYYTFTVLFLIVDFISIGLFLLAKNYNVWSWILNKITCGKYPYEPIEYLTGFIIPQNNVVHDNDYPDKEQEQKEKKQNKSNPKTESLIRNSDINNLIEEENIGTINDG